MGQNLTPWGWQKRETHTYISNMLGSHLSADERQASSRLEEMKRRRRAGDYWTNTYTRSFLRAKVSFFIFLLFVLLYFFSVLLFYSRCFPSVSLDVFLLTNFTFFFTVYIPQQNLSSSIKLQCGYILFFKSMITTNTS